MAIIPYAVLYTGANLRYDENIGWICTSDRASSGGMFLLRRRYGGTKEDWKVPTSKYFDDGRVQTQYHTVTPRVYLPLRAARTWRFK